MNKVISINLNGNAYQLEERGFNALQNYLRESERQLHNNPDKDEILADMEQAIAEKCLRFMKKGKSVILSKEVDLIIEEMGPVQDMDEEATGYQDKKESSQEAREEARTHQKNRSQSAPRKLYRLKDDKMVEGICSGIAAYLGLDPTVVRILFVLLLIMTGGIVAVIYLILALFIPVARTPEEHAAAHGAPFDAQEVIERSRSKLNEFHEHSRHHWQGKGRHSKPVKFILTALVVIIAIGFLAEVPHWSMGPVFMPGPFISSSPWLSAIVLIILIYALVKLIKNVSESDNRANSGVAGILKFCLVVLAIIFAFHMVSLVFWLLDSLMFW